MMFSLRSFLVDLVLLCTDKRPLVDVGVDFNIGVIAELQSILESSCQRYFR